MTYTSSYLSFIVTTAIFYIVSDKLQDRVRYWSKIAFFDTTFYTTVRKIANYFALFLFVTIESDPRPITWFKYILKQSLPITGSPIVSQTDGRTDRRAD